MNRTELKALIKQCLLEIIGEDFIKKIIKESITERINVEVNVPSLKINNNENTDKKADHAPKRALTEEQREMARKLISGEDSDILLPTPKVMNTIEQKFNNPLLKELAKDTVNRSDKFVESQTSFSEAESSLIDINKISAINEAVEERSKKS